MKFELKDVQRVYCEPTDWGDWDIFVVTPQETRLYATSPYQEYAQDIATALMHQAMALRLLPDFVKFTEQAMRELGGKDE